MHMKKELKCTKWMFCRLFISVTSIIILYGVIIRSSIVLDQSNSYTLQNIESKLQSKEYLNCNDIKNELQTIRKVGGGIGKEIFQVAYGNHTFIKSEIRMKRLHETWIVDRVKEGFRNAIMYQNESSVVKVFGYCIPTDEEQALLITEDCTKHGTLSEFINSQTYTKFSFKETLELMIGVVKVFEFLHNLKPARINCDLHEATQALGQFLVTDDLEVVLNDMDELPHSDPKEQIHAICRYEPHCRMTDPTFLAPEQRYSEKSCRQMLPISTVKSDVWKIPLLAKKILKISNNEKINNYLANATKHCQNPTPEERWTTKRVHEAYNNLLLSL